MSAQGVTPGAGQGPEVPVVQGPEVPVVQGPEVPVVQGPELAVVQGPEPGELRRALLSAPAAAVGLASVVVAVLSAVLDDHHLAAALSASAGALVVVAASAVTGFLGVRSAAARPEAVFAAAMVSFMTKVLVFAVALAVIGSVDSARRVPFAVAAITAVLVWLAVEVVLVARLRSTGAAVFGPPAQTGADPASEFRSGPPVG